MSSLACKDGPEWPLKKTFATRQDPKFIPTPLHIRSLPEQSRMLRIRGTQPVNTEQKLAFHVCCWLTVTFARAPELCHTGNSWHGRCFGATGSVASVKVEPLEKKGFKALDLKPSRYFRG